MTPYAILLTLACSATAHFVMACVISLYARHKTEYLCLAWINGIFTFTLLGATFFSDIIACGQPGVLHPLMLLFLVGTTFLQSIYPLSIPMPGFLQWGRMWRYASPAIVLIVTYSLLKLLGGRIVVLHSLSDIPVNVVSSDVLLRLAALCLSIYYTVNIFRLPHRMAHNANVPHYLLGYCFFLGLSVLYYTFMTIVYSPLLLAVYIGMLTVLNMYLSLRVLETMALSLPKPGIEEVKEAPAGVTPETEEEDFNEANLQRFQRMEFWMQNHKEEWTDNTFGRDRLCREVGYNRHLVLQSVRSRGFNNVHDYINTYRIRELKRLVERHEISTVSECMAVGFGAVKTARTCFEKHEGESLDSFLSRNV